MALEVQELYRAIALLEGAGLSIPMLFLIMAGLNDPRVAYWEPAKWAARLRALKTDDNLLLLKTHMGAGHGGASGRYERIREMAYEFAFLLDRLGIEGS